jgi:tetratricopeptide (TPR) repeat protein
MQALHKHAIELYNAGRYSDAEPLYKRALAIHEKALGPDHPDVATSLNNLAALYNSQGRYADAEPLLKRSLAIREKVLGPAHPDVATSLNNLAFLYKSKRRYADAEPLYNFIVIGPQRQRLCNVPGLHQRLPLALPAFASLRAYGPDKRAWPSARPPCGGPWLQGRSCFDAYRSCVAGRESSSRRRPTWLASALTPALNSDRGGKPQRIRRRAEASVELADFKVNAHGF